MGGCPRSGAGRLWCAPRWVRRREKRLLSSPSGRPKRRTQPRQASAGAPGRTARNSRAVSTGPDPQPDRIAVPAPDAESVPGRLSRSVRRRQPYRDHNRRPLRRDCRGRARHLGARRTDRRLRSQPATETSIAVAVAVARSPIRRLSEPLPSGSGWPPGGLAARRPGGQENSRRLGRRSSMPTAYSALTNLYASACAPVAQGIEQRFPKPCAAGSNPAGGTPYPQLTGLLTSPSGLS